MRLQGANEVWPRALRIEQGAGSEPSPRVAEWASALPPNAQCGWARRDLSGGREVVIYLSAEHMVELVPLPLKGRTGQWIELDATLPAGAASPRAYALAPDGRARALSVSLAGRRARARFALSAPGRFVVQLTADIGAGPRPVAEAWVWADVEPEAPLGAIAVAGPAGGAERGLRDLLAEARAGAGLRALLADSALDKVALAHAEAMARAQTLAHELSGTTPAARLDAARVAWSKSGENVAHAATEAGAHEALLRSPSHRENLMNAGYTHVGLGIAKDPHGDGVWVCEVFVRR